MTDKTVGKLAAHNADLVRQGLELISTLTPQVYTRNDHEYFAGGAGKHFRHVFGFYERFLDRTPDGVDYDARGRDPLVESDPQYGLASGRRIAATLDRLAGTPEPDETVRVRTELPDDSGERLVVQSTVARELAVLASHTIHHYAIISMILRIQGVHVPEQFGVAPSTIRHQASLEH